MIAFAVPVDKLTTTQRTDRAPVLWGCSFAKSKFRING